MCGHRPKRLGTSIIHDTLQDRILYGVVMDPFTGCVIPLEVRAFFSPPCTSGSVDRNLRFLVSGQPFYPRLWLFALTDCDVRYWRKPGEEECLLTEGRELTCDLSELYRHISI